MKKVIFIFALVFAASFTFAQQNNATVDQTNGSSAAVTQTNNGVGANQNNNANVDVDGANSAFTVTQTNKNTDASRSASNVATITSTGADNTGDIIQVNQPGGNATVEATLNQTGDNNMATIDQIGFNEATATVTQSVGNAIANIEQVTGSGRKNVQATVTQSGANLANIAQGNDNLNAVVNQTNTGGATGIQNTVDILQGQEDGDLNPGVQGTRAFVTQNGQGNMVDLDQLNAPTARTRRADLDQLGDGNSITLNQGAYSNATIWQDGSNNTFNGVQGAEGQLGDRDLDKELTANQVGDDNTINVTNQGLNASAQLDQNGDFNLINMDQGDTSTVIVTQNGGTSATDSNIANITSSDGSVTITQNNN